jgi:acetylglutamate kinase
LKNNLTGYTTGHNPFKPDSQKIQAVKGQIILIKVGGNALTDHQIKNEIVQQIADISKFGALPVLVHGGGIEIKEMLDKLGIISEFIGGHRKTDEVSLRYIEMALSGGVNKELVALLNQKGVNAVGISGKDANMVIAVKRIHIENIDDTTTEADLGFVGNVDKIDASLVHNLLDAGYVPVISPISAGHDGYSYNINADMFAAHMAGALGAEKFIALSNIDGLLEDISDPESVIHILPKKQAASLYGTIIQGGMIPKIDACLIALEKGVKSSHIINGTKKGELLRILLTDDEIGTTIF